VAAADRNRHAANAYCDRISAKRAKMQRLDCDAFIEAEMPEATGFGFVEVTPAYGCDARLRPDLKLVERDRVRLKGRVHSCD
jgi:hypothetical protein